MIDEADPYDDLLTCPRCRRVYWGSDYRAHLAGHDEEGNELVKRSEA